MLLKPTESTVVFQYQDGNVSETHENCLVNSDKVVAIGHVESPYYDKQQFQIVFYGELVAGRPDRPLIARWYYDDKVKRDGDLLNLIWQMDGSPVPQNHPPLHMTRGGIMIPEKGPKSGGTGTGAFMTDAALVDLAIGQGARQYEGGAVLMAANTLGEFAAALLERYSKAMKFAAVSAPDQPPGHHSV